MCSIFSNKVDEVAWLFNLRAHDIPNFPVALAYAHIGLDDVYLYIDQSRLDEQSKVSFNKWGLPFVPMKIFMKM